MFDEGPLEVQSYLTPSSFKENPTFWMNKARLSVNIKTEVYVIAASLIPFGIDLNFEYMQFSLY